MKHFYMIRHGETDWNREGRLQGCRDIPLNNKGIEQALYIREKLSHLKADVIISSDLIRAQKTAEIINQTLSLPHIIKKGVREIDLGDVEGQQIDELKKKNLTLWNQWIDNHPEFDHITYPSAESKIKVRERAILSLKELSLETPYQTFIVVTHGFLINLLHGHFTGHYRSTFHIQNGEILHFYYNEENQKFYFVDSSFCKTRTDCSTDEERK